MKTVEILCIGTELLMGNITNTNARFMAEECVSAGLSCLWQTTVGDNRQRMAQAIRTAKKRADIVLINGGLGPTEDDLTVEIAAKVCGRELTENRRVLKRIEEQMRVFVRNTPHARITRNNRKMALVPKGCKLFLNENGQAPGIVIRDGSSTLILLPGPPNELIPMFRNQVIPYLTGNKREVLSSVTAKIVNTGESQVAETLSDLIKEQTNPTIATYAKTGEVHVRVTASAKTEKEAKELLAPVKKELKKRFGSDLFTFREEESLEEAIVKLLKKQNRTLATAESCTGGLIASRIVNVPGSSAVFYGGAVTYSNREKVRQLGVKESTLKKDGAVSETCAAEMSDGTVRAFGSDVAIAVTGIAGPGGGSREKPVGLVYFSCTVGKTRTGRKLRLLGNRDKIRENAAQRALVLLRDCLLESQKKG